MVNFLSLSAEFAGSGVEIARNHTEADSELDQDMPLARATEFVDLRDLPPMDVIFGQSSLMAAAREKLERVADTTVPVLLARGEWDRQGNLCQVAACALQSVEVRLG